MAALIPPPMPSPGTLLAAELARVDRPRASTVDTVRYGSQYLATAEAETLGWEAFCARLPVLHAVSIAGLQLVLVSKSVTWSDRDLNVYAGTPDRQVRSYLDLTAGEFASVFGWHLRVAARVAAVLGADVYVTHGFNPTDTSPDAHSVASKLHTHLHVPQDHSRELVTLARLTPFDRLALVEPYAAVFTDWAAAYLVATDTAETWRLTRGFGFLSLTAPWGYATAPAGLAALHRLLDDLHVAYQRVVDALTDGSEETTTGCARLVPRPPRERHARMAALLVDGAGWLSPQSAGLLSYLTEHLAAAAPREHPRSTRITTAAQAWLAKGLSGALNLVVPAAGDRVRVDVAPRVVSTSGAAKVLHPAGPTLVVKGCGPASPAELRRMADFHAVVVAAAGAEQESLR